MAEYEVISSGLYLRVNSKMQQKKKGDIIELSTNAAKKLIDKGFIVAVKKKKKKKEEKAES